MGALAFLAAFMIVASVMAPLVDAGAADSSAPVLSSEPDKGGSSVVLRTWTNEDDSISVDYIKAANSEKYALDVYFNSNFPLNEFVSVHFYLPGHLNIGLDAKNIISAGGYTSLRFEPINSALEPRTHTLTISDDSGKGTNKVFTIELSLSTSLDVVDSGYNEKADDAKEAINDIWTGSDITDIDNRTMYVIYNQTGIFESDLVGKLYFDGKEIYSESLNAANTPGQHIWYFSFAEGAPADISDKYASGTYTMKLFAGEKEVVAETAEIPVQPTPQLKIFVERVVADGKVIGFVSNLIDLSGKELPAGSIKLTYEYAVEFDGYVGVMSCTSNPMDIPEGASDYYSVETLCNEDHIPVSAHAVFEYEDESSSKVIQSETILVWGQM